MIGKVNTVQRNGKRYATFSDVRTTIDFSHFEGNVKYENTLPLVNNMMSQTINANWRIFKGIIYSSLDRYIEDVAKSIFSPLFDQIACQDFYRMK